MILDTDVLIDLRRGVPSANAWLTALQRAPLVSGIAGMQLIEGARNKQELLTIQVFLAAFRAVWPTQEDMVRAHTVYQPLRLANNIDLIDCLTAATATGLELPLATFNVKHFGSVPGLATVQPYTR